MQKLKFELTEHEANLMISCVSDRPLKEVVGLFNTIQQQCAQQINKRAGDANVGVPSKNGRLSSQRKALVNE